MKRALLTLTLGSATTLAIACASEAPESPGSQESAQLTPCSEAGSSPAGVSGSGGGSSAGMGGQDGAGGKASGGSGGAPFVPGPPFTAPAHQGNLIHVKNGCSFPLWIHGIGGGGVLMPDDQKIEAGQSYDYNRGDWPFAYVDAFLDGPKQNRIERAEVTFFPGSYVSYRLNYNDGIGLPMELQAIGPGTDCKAVACYATQAQIMSSCPEGLLSGKRCLSAGEYCKDAANAAKPFCHALDASIAQAGVAGATTAQAYACNKGFGDKQQLCAAVNRGMLSDPTSVDQSKFYGAAPHNGYAAWIHSMCPPDVGAFPYDDATVTQDSFHTCIDADSGTQLNITFCPAG